MADGRLTVEVTLPGQAPQEAAVDLDPFTLKDSRKLQKLVSRADMDDWLRGRVTPVLFEAMIFVKLQRQFPDIGIDDFDVNFADLDRHMRGDNDAPTSVVIPVETIGGEGVEMVQVGNGDPGKA